MAHHEATPEAEHEQARRNATRLFRIHSLEEADVCHGAPNSVDGGSFAAKLAPAKKTTQKAHQEKWVMLLASAATVEFGVGVYHCECKFAVVVVFSGGTVAAEFATYAFVCSADLMDWKAGMRAPNPEKFI